MWKQQYEFLAKGHAKQGIVLGEDDSLDSLGPPVVLQVEFV